MKKIKLFIASAILVFCIVPISTTQAMPQRTQGEDFFASTRPNAALSISIQEELRNIVVELSNQKIKSNLLTFNKNGLHGTTIAMNGQGKSTTTRSSVHRSGHGRSTMGDNTTKKHGENEEDENEEDEKFGDDSAIKYNRGLDDTSGYNEDL